MKTLLSCDDVFEQLTAGPIREGSPHGIAVTEHITECQSCRELAEALRPACHLVHEALPDDLRCGLPVFLAADDDSIEQVMTRLEVLPARKTATFGRQAWIGMAIASGIVLMLLFWRQTSTEHPSLVDVNAALQSFYLPSTCIQLASIDGQMIHPELGQAACESCHDSPHAINALRHTCCTECHGSSSDVKSQVSDVTRLVAACVTCH